MSNEKPVAIELADLFDNWATTFGEHPSGSRSRGATELRRQHARIQELEAMLEVKAIKPLTDEQLSEIAGEHTRSVGCYNCSEQAIPDRHNRIEDFARAIERAHGIGATPCN